MPPRRVLALALAGCAIGLCACGAQLAPRTIASNPLESLIALRSFPVYWLGSSYDGLPLTEITHTSAGAISLQYGDCVRGGQYECITPLTVVTSPENSFRPHGAAATRTLRMRDVRSFAALNGRTVEIPTGPVVVSLYADRASLARAAARVIVPLNALGMPDAPLPPAQTNSAFASKPLPGQMHTITSTSTSTSMASTG